MPVVNALTDTHHPCQALADLLTLQEHFGTLAGLEVAYVGDGNNVAHSLIEACVLAGIHVAAGVPGGLPAALPTWSRGRRPWRRRGGSVRVLDDPAEAVAGAHAVYTDVFVSMGEDDVREQKLAVLGRYQVDETLMARARPTRCSCTACRRTAARRSPMRSSRGRSPSCSTRPRTACTPPPRCW